MGRNRAPGPAERRRRIIILWLGATVAALAVLAAPAVRHRPPATASLAARSATTGPPPVERPAAPVVVSSTVPAPTTVPTTIPPTTSTTADPGSLPQTSQLPSANDPAFLARMNDLWKAIVTGDPAVARPAFFPLSAYIQVKAIAYPVSDYNYRLIADFDQDIATLHSEIYSEIGEGAALASVVVPDAAEWITPGVEYNKGSYWRVYGTRVDFTAGGQTHYFSIASMISWRGEWYVVHLNSIR